MQVISRTQLPTELFGRSLSNANVMEVCFCIAKLQSSTEKWVRTDFQEKHINAEMGLLTVLQIWVVTIQRFKLCLNVVYII